jgi:hypothetical protein
MPRVARWQFVLLAVLLFETITWSAQDDPIRLERLFEAASVDDGLARAALTDLATNWRSVDAAMLVEMVAVLQIQSPTASVIRRRILAFLEQQSGQSFGEDTARWRDWVRASPARSSAQSYARFKRALYTQVEPLADTFFAPGATAAVRLDEIVWSGTTVGKSRPLNYPDTVAADDATFMKPSDTVFGVAFGRGQLRAYPMATLERYPVIHDRFNGREVTIVHCRRSGSTVAFESDIEGHRVTLDDSGFVYRSSTVLFDERTKSLWSMVTGQPLVGELVSSGLNLRALAATTVVSWKEWLSMNPATTVSTGRAPVGADGLATATPRETAATEREQVSVAQAAEPMSPGTDVLGMQFIDQTSGEPVRLAIGLDFLRKHPLYTFSRSTQQVVDPFRMSMIVITSPEGAFRVYRMIPPRSFPAQPFEPTFVDDMGVMWRMAEGELTTLFLPAGRTLVFFDRLPAPRVSWLAWHDYFPDSLIIR